MHVTERGVERIPPGNLRVPRGEFAALWRAAEKLSIAQARHGITDWPAGAVALTCRWVARAMTETADGRRVLTPAPITKVTTLASEELIEAEFVAAQTLAARVPAPAVVTSRPGFVDAVCATLRWAWRSSGPVPVLSPAG